MTICFFGIYHSSYSRNRVLMKGLQENGHRIIECRVDSYRYHGFRKYWELYKEWRRIRHERISFVLVAYPGQSVMWLARILFGRRVVFDAFISMYDSNVFDRKRHTPHSLAALRDWFWDWSSTVLAPITLLDTNEHIAYFVKTFHVPHRKFRRVWIGADQTIFYPRKAVLQEKFTVHFHGTFIPLQGISYILDAARLLRSEPIQFRIVGNGQTFPFIEERVIKNNLQNVTLVGKVPLEKVPEYIASAHVCLGIFGDTDKTQRVIPNKVYECMAMGKIVITADTLALHELIPDDLDSVIRIPRADGPALASTIRTLMSYHNNKEGVIDLGKKNLAFFEGHCTACSIVATLLKELPPRFTKE